MKTAVLVVITAIFAAVISLTQLSGFTSDSSETPAIAYTVAERYEPLAWLRGGERFPSGAQILIREGDKSRPFVQGFAATADPAISFDGSMILFAAKKSANDSWQIWEAKIDGSDARRVVASEADVVRPLYLPDSKLVYSAKRNGSFTLEIASLEGGKPQPVFFAPGNVLASEVLRDGRILFQAAYPLGSNGAPELYTVYTDGSGMESYRCDHSDRARYAGRQLSAGNIIFTHGKEVARFTSPLATEEAIAMPAGEYAGDVVESTSGWIVPYRSNAQSKFALKVYDPATRKLSNIVSEAGKHALQPVMLAPHAVPPRHPSALLARKDAELLALNVYTSKYNFAPGSVANVKVYSRDAAGKAKLLGSAPVEKDGSFFVRVPADEALKFELTDASGRTLKKEAGWLWARAGEQRVCVGCHAGPEHAPENDTPLALTRSTEPVNLAGQTSHAQSGGN